MAQLVVVDEVAGGAVTAVTPLGPLPGPDADDEAVARWVRGALSALDDRPRDRLWRYRAAGTLAEAVAEAPRDYRLDMRVPVGEMRLLNAVARERGLGTRAYARRAIGQALVACEGLAPADVPYLTKGGLIAPRWNL